uniref:Reverse transcriptase Ty1/copia-type domain-containing protein n=1 Tax=Peronospora matthiolae TaxID=2874970 RepID=A0AAV1TI45_9STRA
MPLSQGRKRKVRAVFGLVDDVLVTGSSTEVIVRTKSDLKRRFDMTDSGKCAFVLGIELVNNIDGSVTMCQRRYVDDVLKRFGMSDCKAVISPTDISSRLTPSDAATKNNAPSREAVGALMHLMTATRPDVAFVVGYVSRSMENPKSSIGWQSSAFFVIYKKPSHTASSLNPTTRWIYVATRMQTSPVIMKTASRLQNVRLS